RLTELQNRGDRKTTEKSATTETTVGRTWEKQPISNEATKAKNERQVLLSSSRLALRYWKRITTLLTSAIFRALQEAQKSLKSTSSVMATATGWPFLLPGSNSQVLTFSRAFWSRPIPRLRTTFRLCGLPSGPMTAESVTVPWYLALRASSEKSGSGVNFATGGVTPISPME